MDEFVGSDPLDHLGGEFRIGSVVDEEVGGEQDLLCLGEAEFGTELDDQEVGEEREQRLDRLVDLGHPALAGLVAGDVRLGLDVGVRVGPQREIAEHEPHRVVTADAAFGLAALVETVRGQEALVEVTDRHLGDVLDDRRLQVGHGQLCEEASPRLDLARDRQAVPEDLSEAVAEQYPLLLGSR